MMAEGDTSHVSCDVPPLVENMLKGMLNTNINLKNTDRSWDHQFQHTHMHLNCAAPLEELQCKFNPPRGQISVAANLFACPSRSH